jgi:hypothetical protein
MLCICIATDNSSVIHDVPVRQWIFISKIYINRINLIIIKFYKKAMDSI